MSYSPKNANGQATMANSEPVVIASDQSAVPVSADSLPLPTGAATEATLASVKTAVETIDNAIAGTEMQVDIVSLPAVDTELTTADLDTGAGTDTRAVVGLVGSKSGGAQLIPGDATAGLKVDLGADNDVTVTGTVTVDGSGVTQPVYHAALTELAAAINASSQVDVNIAASGATVPVSNAGLTALNGAIAGTEVQVDVVGPLPAGTNAIGKLAANSGVDIGDVDVTSLPAIPAGTNNIGDVDIASAIPAGENHIGEVGTNGVSVGVELTRPADTTAYAINDAVADSTSSPTVLTFTNLGRVNAGSGYIVKAILSTDQKTNVAQFRLHLFNASPTAVNDNALLGILYADNASYIGCIDFPVMATEDSTASTKAYGIWTGQLHFVCGASTHTLYGLLETKTVFTPASGQKFYIKLNADNN